MAFLLLAAALAAPAGAGAAIVQIDGDPLDVFLSDEGRLQARFAGTQDGTFFPPGENQANAGFQLGVDLQEHPSGRASMFGFDNLAFTPGGQNAVSGSGTATDPYRQVTTFTAVTPATQQPITVSQTAQYVNGTGIFSLGWDVTNLGTTPTTVRPTLAGDLYAGGRDAGTGFFEDGPPRVVGSVPSSSVGSAGIVELTPWAAFEEDYFATVFSHLRDLSAGGGLRNTINPESVDSGAGVQGPDQTICATGCPSGTITFEAAWRFVEFLSADPARDTSVVGTPHTVIVKVVDEDKTPQPGVPINYTIAGVNPSQGVLPTDAAGSVSITWTSAAPGTDSLSAFADLNRNGVQDADEPVRRATVEWLAPVAGRTAIVEAVRGTVLVRLPPGASPARYGLREQARRAQNGVIRVTQPTTLPVGSTVNARRGEATMSTARDLRGGIQSANFFSGTFQFLQRRTARPMTDIVLKGGGFRSCPSARSSGGEPRADAAQRRGRRVRRLWGSGRGRFRTSGRYSSATVRGTTWLTEDYCNGTFTAVASRPRTNRVQVRDFVQRRSRLLRAGQSYFAARPLGRR